MNLYLVVKHLHLTVVGLALLGLMLRFARQAGLFPRTWGAGLLRLTDLGVWLTLLTGILLAWLTGQTGFGLLQPWLLEKLVLLAAVLLLAFYALRGRGGWPGRALAMLAVLGLLYAIAQLALHKHALLMG